MEILYALCWLALNIIFLTIGVVSAFLMVTIALGIPIERATRHLPAPLGNLILSFDQVTDRIADSIADFIERKLL
jgi:uncharacterized membrane protein YccF (DUF307 family)